MKEVKDGTISSRIYYYLLEWNESDGWKTMLNKFNKTQLHCLTVNEICELFMFATNDDYNYWKDNNNETK